VAVNVTASYMAVNDDRAALTSVMTSPNTMWSFWNVCVDDWTKKVPKKFFPGGAACCTCVILTAQFVLSLSSPVRRGWWQLELADVDGRRRRRAAARSLRASRPA
jgi:hypothetical protein